MQIKYSDDADVMVIQLKDGEPVDSRDISEGVILHLNEDSSPLEIEILDASQISDIQSVLNVPLEKPAA
jgi:uncharacterized protein YuzE